MEKIENANEKINDFAEDHPVAFLAICGLGGFAVCVPLCVLCYKWLGKTAGKAAAKELIDAGVKIGY